MESTPPESAAGQVVGERAVRRIVRLIPGVGVVAGLLAAFLHRWDWTVGIVLGAGLAWLNFRWLKRALEAFTNAAAAQSRVSKPRVPTATYLAAALRYGLIGFAVYAIFQYSHVPLVSLALGLSTFAVAVITASVWEILESME